MVALYWQELWWRLLGADRPPNPVLATFPADGGGAHPRDADLPTSWYTLVFARGLEADTVGPEAFQVLDSQGQEVEVEPWLFYRQASHVVHLLPVADWAEDEDYTVTVLPGVTSIDGWALDEPLTFTFSTRAAELEPEPSGGCATPPLPAGRWALLFSLLGWGARRRRRPSGVGYSPHSQSGQLS